MNNLKYAYKAVCEALNDMVFPLLILTQKRQVRDKL